MQQWTHTLDFSFNGLGDILTLQLINEIDDG